MKLGYLGDNIWQLILWVYRGSKMDLETINCTKVRTRVKEWVRS